MKRWLSVLGLGVCAAIWTGCAALPAASPAVSPLIEAASTTLIQKPVAATLVDSKVKIPAKKYMWWKLEIPNGSEVTFDVHVDSDVNIFLFADEEQFRSWQRGREHTKIAEAAKVVDWTYMVKTTQPSVYYLIVSNQHSILTGKNVTLLIKGMFPPKQSRSVNSGLAP